MTITKHPRLLHITRTTVTTMNTTGTTIHSFITRYKLLPTSTFRAIATPKTVTTRAITVTTNTQLLVSHTIITTTLTTVILRVRLL